MPRLTIREKRRAERPPDSETGPAPPRKKRDEKTRRASTKKPAPNRVTPTAGPPRKKHRRKQRCFDELCDALAVYKAANFHINVPNKYTKDPALGQWVAKTRMTHGTTLLTPEQKAQLNELGFDWETKKEKDEKRWDEMLKKLKKYRRVQLDCRVPRTWSSDPQLARWVQKQRRKETNNKLPPHHKEQLDAINFRWRQRKTKINNTAVADAKWFKNYQMLATYQEEHGDCLVPQKVNGPDRTLASWVRTQRETYRDGKLKEERKKWLDEIGFVYKIDKADPNASRTQKHWDDMCDHWVEFKEKNGHVDVKRSYSKWGLGTWVNTQKAAARNGTLDQRRAARLQEIGIPLGKGCDERWEDGFAMIVKYQKKYGHCSVPRYDSFNEGNFNGKLSKWVRYQMFLEATDVLLPEKKKRLDTIGFPFGSCDFCSDEED